MVYYFDNAPPFSADPAAKARFPPGLRTREGYGWYLSRSALSTLSTLVSPSRASFSIIHIPLLIHCGTRKGTANHYIR